MKSWFVRVWRAMTSPPPKEVEAPKIPDGAMKSFVDAFDSRVSGCRRDCACGREFWDNYNDGYDWDEGEREALAANRNATPLPYAVSTVEFEGSSYVYDCDCWRPRAKRIVAFILGHADEIADFLSLEKKRRQEDAERFASGR